MFWPPHYRLIHHTPPLVQVSRDAWDWAALIAALVLLVTGLITFLFWLAQIRRKPEIEYGWSLSRGDSTGPYVPWPRDGDPVVLRPGQPLFLRIGLTNIGDALADHAIANVLVPEQIELFGRGRDDRPVERILSGAENTLAGLPPEYRVRNLISERSPWGVGLTWIIYCHVQVTDETPTDRDLTISCEVDTEGFNRSGRRYWFSLTPRPRQRNVDSPKLERLTPRWIRADRQIYRGRAGRIDLRKVRRSD